MECFLTRVPRQFTDAAKTHFARGESRSGAHGAGIKNSATGMVQSIVSRSQLNAILSVSRTTRVHTCRNHTMMLISCLRLSVLN